MAGPLEAIQGLAYRPHFIDADEESALLGRIAELPLREAEYRQYTARRRIVAFGSQYNFGAQRLERAPDIPEFLRPLLARTARWAGIPEADFVHALVTEYRPDTQLGWHRDTPEFGIVAGISLGGAARMRFRPYPPRPGQKSLVLELEPRSAYVMLDQARWGWQHGIAPTPALRYSITFRTLRARSRPVESTMAG